MMDINVRIIVGAPSVQVVFTIKWSKLAGGRVKGVLEVYGHNAAGGSNLLHIRALSNIICHIIRVSNLWMHGLTVLPFPHAIRGL